MCLPNLWTSVSLPGSPPLSLPPPPPTENCSLFSCEVTANQLADRESKGDTFWGEILGGDLNYPESRGSQGLGKKPELPRPSPVFTGACSQPGLRSQTGRFSQSQDEPEVRSCGPGHQPAPDRSISWKREKSFLGWLGQSLGGSQSPESGGYLA